MRDRDFLILLVAASVIVKSLIAVFLLQGFGIDESLYLATARDYADTGVFGILTEFNDFRFIAPLLAFVMAGFYKLFGDVGPLLVSPIMGSLAIIPMFLITKIAIDRNAGRLAAILLAVNPAFFLLNTRPLTESIAFLLFTSAILFFILAMRDKRYWIAALPAAVATFLARYPYGAILIFFFAAVVLLERKIKSLASYRTAIGVSIAILVVLPWMYFNYESYGNPLGGAIHHAADVGFDYWKASWYVPYLFIIAGATFPFMIYSLLKDFREKSLLFSVVGFFLVFLVQFFLFGETVEERYILPVLPFALVLTVSGYQHLLKWNKATRYVMIAMVAINIIAALYVVDIFAGLPKYSETYEALAWMQQNCGPTIFGNVFTPTYNVLGVDVIHPQFDQSLDAQTISEKNVDCAIVSEHEAPYTDFFPENVGTEKVSFGKVHVYKIA